MQTRPLGAQLSHMLKDRGVEVIFGIPGVHNQEMYRGIEEAGLTHILARHEQGAGFMADGYARATGRPGVCYVITGPGLCNIMTPMGQAYSDSVPLLVISSCLDETAMTRGQLHQMLDQEGAARAVCDWSETARTAEAAYGLIDRALGELKTKRARPKHLQVPINVLEATAPPAPIANKSDVFTPPRRDDYASSKIFEALRSARRPIILLGGGAISSWTMYDKIAQWSGSVTFTTYAGRGIISDANPLHAGALLARPESAKLFATADLVLAVGTEISEVDLWRQNLGHDCPMIRVDLDPSSLGSVVHPSDETIYGEAFETLEPVYDFLKESPSNSDWDAGEISDFRSRMRAEINAERPGILPVADALREALPADTMIFSDMTQFAYAAKEIWPMDRPAHWHHPYGFGTLGYALPAAIGGKIGVGDQPVVAIAGDYGFQYTLQELGAAVELGLSLPIIVWDNGKLGEIEDSMVRAQIAPNAVIQRNPDFCKLAEAYGAHSARPETLAEMQEAVKAALKADGPTLIHLRASSLA